MAADPQLTGDALDRLGALGTSAYRLRRRSRYVGQAYTDKMAEHDLETAMLLDALIAQARRAPPSAVAWRVKDYADGWVFFTDEASALLEWAETGALMQPLYASPIPPEGGSADRPKAEGGAEYCPECRSFSHGVSWCSSPTCPSVDQAGAGGPEGGSVGVLLERVRYAKLCAQPGEKLNALLTDVEAALAAHQPPVGGETERLLREALALAALRLSGAADSLERAFPSPEYGQSTVTKLRAWAAEASETSC